MYGEGGGGGGKLSCYIGKASAAIVYSQKLDISTD